MSNAKEQITNYIIKYWENKLNRLPKIEYYLPIVDKITEKEVNKFKPVRKLEEFLDCIRQGKIFLYNRISVEDTSREYSVDFADNRIGTRLKFYQVPHFFSIIFFSSPNHPKGIDIMYMGKRETIITKEDVIKKIVEIYDLYIDDPTVIILRTRPVVRTKEEIPIIRNFILQLVRPIQKIV